ncbi:MAG: preprotein translocase subunit YajC [Actinomycetota bacterium]|jgi:preprotein translocase subunit YajC|nr:preprotein translocase subunit YajC [Actinomycetota bacterium]MDQ1552213.1 preprotein translocase subunit YajC [Actinomycetota bacterium]
MDQTYIIVIFAVLLIGFMIFSSRRNRKRQATLREAIVPGVEVMTNFGLFGKLLSVDEATNVAEIETSPGTIVRVHRQTLSKVVTPEELSPSTSGDAPRSVEEAMAIANREQADRDAAAKVDSEAPAYGERIDDPITKATTKRAPRAPKKTDD